MVLRREKIPETKAETFFLPIPLNSATFRPDFVSAEPTEPSCILPTELLFWNGSQSMIFWCLGRHPCKFNQILCHEKVFFMKITKSTRQIKLKLSLQQGNIDSVVFPLIRCHFDRIRCYFDHSFRSPVAPGNGSQPI